LKCPAFLKLIFRFNIQLFSDFLISLSAGNEEFTILSCVELVKFNEDILDDRDLIKIFKAISSLLQLKDLFQTIRFEILLGIPQLSIEDSNFYYKYPSFGYHKLKNEFDDLNEYRGTMASKETCSFLKKIFLLKGYQGEAIACELFLTILESATNNPELLKYLVCLPSQEPCYEE